MPNLLSKEDRKQLCKVMGVVHMTMKHFGAITTDCGHVVITGNERELSMIENEEREYFVYCKDCAERLGGKENG